MKTLIKKVLGWHPYTYINTRSASLGAGVSELALQRPQSYMAQGYAGPRYNVRGSLGPQAPAYVKEGQSVIPTSLLGNGFGTFTGIALQGLGNPPKITQG